MAWTAPTARLECSSHLAVVGALANRRVQALCLGSRNMAMARSPHDQHHRLLMVGAIRWGRADHPLTSSGEAHE